MTASNTDQPDHRPLFRLFALWRLIAAVAVMFYHLGLYGPS
ncbi:hypothetical protein [uncultured Cohaesibacter sp.]|nr:hypothetical protein [uncultured Cohaesibacter sp.]